MKGGWKTVKLGDISEISYGYTAKASCDTAGPKFLRITDIQNGSVDWHKVPTCPISAQELEKHRLRENDIVFARTGATTGKSCCILEPPEAVAASYLIRLRIKTKDIDPALVAYFFQTRDYWNSITSGISGSAQGGFNASKLAQLQFPRPPLNEQKRIVAILDEAYAGIKTAIANTEKNLANAHELFESYLNAVFNQSGEGWIESRLCDCASAVSTGPFGSLLHKSDYVSDGVPLVNPINIVGSTILPDDNKRIGHKTKTRLLAYVLRKGDIVIARRGEIGRCAVVREEQDGWVCGTGCFFVRPFPNVNACYLANMIRSFSYRSELERQSTGATMKNLSNKVLSNLKIILPETSDQDLIVEEIENLSQQICHVESLYNQKLSALAELKQSLLQKAFSGELTAEAVDEAQKAVA